MGDPSLHEVRFPRTERQRLIGGTKRHAGWVVVGFGILARIKWRSPVSGPSKQACLASSPIPATLTHARRRCSAHGFAVRSSRKSEWRCITSSAIRSAIVSIYPMRKRMRFCCRIRLPITPGGCGRFGAGDRLVRRTGRRETS